MLVQAKEIHLSFGPKKLIRGASFVIEEQDRICLIGRNGTGKSTLFKIITEQIVPDGGEVLLKKNLIVSELKQTLPFGLDISSFDFIKEGLVVKQRLIEEFQVLSQALTEKSSPTKGELAEIDEIQNRIENTGGWDLDLMVKTIMSELSLPNQNLKELSGGWQRRVALAKALVSKPELLLLDEPTNHLDIETIEWLENKINQYAGAVIFVTHDRNFLKKIASKILELDRGLIYTYPGSYEEHLTRKAEALDNERKHNKLFDKKLAEEEIWINQGVKARRTRNEGRVRSLEKMREVKDERVKPERDLKIQIAETVASGKKIVDLEKVGHRFNQGGNEKWLIEDFTLKIKRGEKIGLVGNNGVGKSTLLKILTGKITPEKGTVKFGANLEQVYFDQVHRDLKANQTISYNISDGRNYIEMNGKSIHVVGYLKNYLFDYERSNEKVDRLSGGEKNRVLLARLFASPSNLLILDEPTNDLDLEMIEALEEALKNYDGTIIMVSHDRYFLDKVATACLVFEDDGVIRKYHGGYSDWLDLKDRYGKGLKVVDTKENAKRIKQNSKKSERQNNKKRQEASDFSEEKKSSTKERKKKEKKLLLEISELEKTVADLSKEVSSEEFQNKPFEKQSTLYDRIAEVQIELDEKTEEWAGLDS